MLYVMNLHIIPCVVWIFGGGGVDILKWFGWHVNSYVNWAVYWAMIPHRYMGCMRGKGSKHGDTINSNIQFNVIEYEKRIFRLQNIVYQSDHLLD